MRLFLFLIAWLSAYKRFVKPRRELGIVKMRGAYLCFKTKTTMKKHANLLMLAAFTSLSFIANAQTPQPYSYTPYSLTGGSTSGTPSGTGGTGGTSSQFGSSWGNHDHDCDVPLDGGLSLLIAAGAGIGAKRLMRKKTAKQA